MPEAASRLVLHPSARAWRPLPNLATLLLPPHLVDEDAHRLLPLVERVNPIPDYVLSRLPAQPGTRENPGLGGKGLNEVVFSVEAFAELLGQGNEVHYAVQKGLPPGAKIVGAYFDVLTNSVVLTFDQPIHQPLLERINPAWDNRIRGQTP